MDNSEGKFTNYGKKVGSEIYANLLHKKHEMLPLFKQQRKYGWFFANLDAQKYRFTPNKRKMSFEQLMRLKDDDNML